MGNEYGIAIYNKDLDYVIKPLLSEQLKDDLKIGRVFIIASKTVKTDEIESKINSFFEFIRVRVNFIYLDDITNFFQTFLVVRLLCIKEGPPKWMNISCGSGIGMAALTAHAIERDISLVTYDKDMDRSFIFNIHKLKRIDIINKRYLQLLSGIQKGYNDSKKLAYFANVDRSTVLRRVNNLIFIDIVKIVKDGKSNHQYIFDLTNFGRWVIENLEFLENNQSL